MTHTPAQKPLLLDDPLQRLGPGQSGAGQPPEHHDPQPRTERRVPPDHLRRCPHQHVRRLERLHPADEEQHDGVPRHVEARPGLLLGLGSEGAQVDAGVGHPHPVGRGAVEVDQRPCLLVGVGDQRVGPGDTFIAAELADLKRARRTPVVAVATKSDLVDKQRLAEHLIAIDSLGEWDAIVPCSATRGDQVDVVAEQLTRYLPESPKLYPDDVLTDEPQIVMIAELVREAALEGVRDELPHSLAVVVEEMVPRPDRPEDDPLLDVRVDVFVERSSQKAIVIGRGGSRLRDVGTRARAGIEALLGQRIHLDLHVKVAKDWQRDPRQLRRLGF